MAVSTIDPAGLNIGQIGGRRNLIINGAMQVAQRGTSFAAISNGSFGIDRFKHIQAGTMVTTVSQSTDAPSGFASSLKYQTTTAQASLGATDRLEARYAIEAQDLQHLDYGLSTAKATTLSFWVKSNKTGTYCVWVFAPDNTRSISKSYTINTADTWEYKTITFAGDTSGGITNDNGIGVWISFFLGAGSTFQSGTQATSWESYVLNNIAVNQTVNIADSTSNYINITGVQLEVSPSGEATPFEHRSYGEELALCQRYYQRKGGGAYEAFGTGSYYNANATNLYMPFPAGEMRATPSFQSSAVSTFTMAEGRSGFVLEITTFNYGYAGKTGALFQPTPASAGTTDTPYVLCAKATSNAWIAFDAEL